MRLSSLPSTLLWLSIIPTVLSSWSGYRIDKRHDHDNQWANTEVEGIDAGLLAQFKLMSEYAAAAYWPGNNNSTGDLISCSGDSCPTVPEGNCPQVEAANATTVVEFEHGPFDDTGFVAVDDTNKLVVLAFRGSKSKKNWHEDFKLWRTDSDLCYKCTIHKGFWESWVGARATVMPNVMSQTDAHQDYRFAIVGHSLGAALATLAAGEIRKQSEWLLDHTELYTFGSPRIGTHHAAIFLTEQSQLSYRITAMNDPIPRVPWKFFGYRHTSPEYWIHNNPDDPEPEDINVLGGINNSKGNDGTHGRHMWPHHHYFGYISGCDPDGQGRMV